MARTFTTTFAFNANGLGSLIRARNIVKSLGGTSWGAFNQMSRAAGSAQREFAKMAAGFGTGIGFGMVAKSMISANAELQTNRLIFENMVGEGEEANKMIAMLQENAAKYGFDLGEVMKSARGLYSGFSSGNRKVDTDDLNSLMQMAETLNALDTENRGISFAAFSLKEVAQGVGKMDFKSMTNRMEIPFKQSTQQAITKALQSGETKKALDLLWQGLAEAKVPRNLLDKMADEGFLQNLNRLKSYIGRIFLGVGEPLFKHLAFGLAKFNKVISDSFKPNSPFMNTLAIAGKQMYDNIAGAVLPAFDAIAYWVLSPAGQTFFTTLEIAFADIKAIAAEALRVIGAFFAGFGFHTEGAQDDIRKFIAVVGNEIKTMLPKLQPFAFALGKIARAVADLVIKNPDLAATLVTFQMFGGGAILGGILKLVGGIGRISTAAGLGGASTAIDGLAISIARLIQPVGLGALADKLYLIRYAAQGVFQILALNPITRFGLYGAALATGVALGNLIRYTFPSVDKWWQRLADGALRYAGIVGGLSNKAVEQNQRSDISLSARQAQALARYNEGKNASAEDLKIVKTLHSKYGGDKEFIRQQLKDMGAYTNMFGGFNQTKFNLDKNASDAELLAKMAKMMQPQVYQNAIKPPMLGPTRGEQNWPDQTTVQARGLNQSGKNTQPFKVEVGNSQKQLDALQAIAKKPTTINMEFHITGDKAESIAKKAAEEINRTMTRTGGDTRTA
jgi:hypothetical protein